MCARSTGPLVRTTFIKLRQVAAAGQISRNCGERNLIVLFAMPAALCGGQVCVPTSRECSEAIVKEGESCEYARCATLIGCAGRRTLLPTRSRNLPASRVRQAPT